MDADRFECMAGSHDPPSKGNPYGNENEWRWNLLRVVRRQIVYRRAPAFDWGEFMTPYRRYPQAEVTHLGPAQLRHFGPARADCAACRSEALLHLRRQDWADDPHQRKKISLLWVVCILAGLIVGGWLLGAGLALVQVMWRWKGNRSFYLDCLFYARLREGVGLFLDRRDGSTTPRRP